jgi:HEPN domain-containing protein
MPLNASQEWLDQAERDLAAARHLRTGGYHEWACFVAQQAGEKALKALRIRLGSSPNEWIRPGFGHDLARLLGQVASLAPSVSQNKLLANLEALSNHEQEARYPGGGSKGKAPFTCYNQKRADQAIQIAEALDQFCRKLCAAVGVFWNAQ